MLPFSAWTIVLDVVSVISNETSSPLAVTISWQDRIYVTYKLSKLGQTGLVLVCDQRSSVDLRMQDYKSLRVAVMIYATLVNRQTHRQTAFDRLYY